MSQDTIVSLKELQKLDEKMERIRERIGRLEESLADAETPLVEAEEHAKATRDRLQQMRLDERRLESSAEEKRTRAKRLEQRLNEVQNVREETAVRAELDMVQRALDGDEQEALGLMDQIRRVEETLAEQEEAVREAREEVGPRKEELEEERKQERERLAELEKRRQEYVERIGEGERKVYESFRAGGRTVVVVSLLEDGACGHCFGMVPLQIQNEIRGGAEMLRCEECGVILTAPEAAGEE